MYISNGNQTTDFSRVRISYVLYTESYFYYICNGYMFWKYKSCEKNILEIKFRFLLHSYSPLFFSCFNPTFLTEVDFPPLQILVSTNLMVRTWTEKSVFLHPLAELLVQAQQYPTEFIKDIIKIQSTVAVTSVLLVDAFNFYNVSASTGYISIKYLG